jgi:hypothetical protein
MHWVEQIIVAIIGKKNRLSILSNGNMIEATHSLVRVALNAIILACYENNLKTIMTLLCPFTLDFKLVSTNFLDTI